MKLHKSLLLFGASALLLAACGDEVESTGEEATEEPEVAEVVDDVEADETTETDDAEEVEDTDSPEQQAGDVIEADGGTRTIVATNYGIDEVQENGSFTVTVTNAQLSQFQPSEDMVDVFGGEDLGMVTIQMNVANSSEDTNSIYPDQGIIVTDTGQQVNAEVFLSDQVGGDFYGNVTKSGDVFFFFDGQAEEISSVRYIIDSGHDENFETFGEDLEFLIEF